MVEPLKSSEKIRFQAPPRPTGWGIAAGPEAGVVGPGGGRVAAEATGGAEEAGDALLGVWDTSGVAGVLDPDPGVGARLGAATGRAIVELTDGDGDGEDGEDVGEVAWSGRFLVEEVGSVEGVAPVPSAEEAGRRSTVSAMRIDGGGVSGCPLLAADAGSGLTGPSAAARPASTRVLWARGGITWADVTRAATTAVRPTSTARGVAL
jgi:hypothetical protein